MDPVLGSVIAGFIASSAAVIIAIVTGRNSAERLTDKDLIRRLKRRLVDVHGEDPADVEEL